MCMCGSPDCWSCGYSSPRPCYNCGRSHIPGSKRGEKCLEAMRNADKALYEQLQEEERLAQEYFSEENKQALV